MPPPPGPPVPAVTVQPVSMTLVSNVTEALSDMALPHPIVAPVLRAVLAFEIMVPRNVVVVPRVAPLVTAQVMLPVNGPAEPASTTLTL